VLGLVAVVRQVVEPTVQATPVRLHQPGKSRPVPRLRGADESALFLRRGLRRPSGVLDRLRPHHPGLLGSAPPMFHPLPPRALALAPPSRGFLPPPPLPPPMIPDRAVNLVPPLGRFASPATDGPGARRLASQAPLSPAARRRVLLQPGEHFLVPVFAVLR